MGTEGGADRRSHQDAPRCRAVAGIWLTASSISGRRGQAIASALVTRSGAGESRGLLPRGRSGRCLLVRAAILRRLCGWVCPICALARAARALRSLLVRVVADSSPLVPEPLALAAFGLSASGERLARKSDIVSVASTRACPQRAPPRGVRRVGGPARGGIRCGPTGLASGGDHADASVTGAGRCGLVAVVCLAVTRSVAG